LLPRAYLAVLLIPAQIIKTIDPIDSKIVEPDPAIFNSNAINPAVEVQISGTSQSGTQ